MAELSNSLYLTLAGSGDAVLLWREMEQLTFDVFTSLQVLAHLMNTKPKSVWSRSRYFRTEEVHDAVRRTVLGLEKFTNIALNLDLQFKFHDWAPLSPC